MNLLLVALALTSAAPERELRVCADPNNLPFSNRAEEGFENKLVNMIAADLGAKVTYTWWAQRRGNVRETLNEDLCDLIPGVASSLEMLTTTRPYYRSTYVAVTRAESALDMNSFDDPRLKDLRIGVQLIGDDGSNTPPAHALSRRGHVGNVSGYTVYGEYSRPHPQQDIVAAVASGEIDVAYVWGPVAGYFARRQPVPLRLSPVAPFDGPQLPMVYDISMGVKKGNQRLREEIEAILAKRAPVIAGLLAGYGVPMLDESGETRIQPLPDQPK